MSQSDMTMGTHPAVLERSSPFAIPTKKLAMWLFIIADARPLRHVFWPTVSCATVHLNWPTPFKFFPTVVNAMVMTFILITSSLTMFLGVRAAKMGDRSAAVSLDHDHRSRRGCCSPCCMSGNGSG